MAGATGETGRRVVQQLCAAGVTTVAGVRSIDKAKARAASPRLPSLPWYDVLSRPPVIRSIAQKLGLDAKGALLVKADVTASPSALAAAIGDAEAVVCCIGFAPSFNLGVDNPTKVDGQGTISLVDAAKLAGVKKFVMARCGAWRSRETWRRRRRLAAQLGHSPIVAAPRRAGVVAPHQRPGDRPEGQPQLLLPQRPRRRPRPEARGGDLPREERPGLHDRSAGRAGGVSVRGARPADRLGARHAPGA